MNPMGHLMMRSGEVIPTTFAIIFTPKLLTLRRFMPAVSLRSSSSEENTKQTSQKGPPVTSNGYLS